MSDNNQIPLYTIAAMPNGDYQLTMAEGVTSVLGSAAAADKFAREFMADRKRNAGKTYFDRMPPNPDDGEP